MVLNDAYLARMQPLVKEIMSVDGRRRPSRVKRLQRKLEELREPAQLAEYKFLAAMYFRWGPLPGVGGGLLGGRWKS